MSYFFRLITTTKLILNSCFDQITKLFTWNTIIDNEEYIVNIINNTDDIDYTLKLLNHNQ